MYWCEQIGQEALPPGGRVEMVFGWKRWSVLFPGKFWSRRFYRGLNSLMIQRSVLRMSKTKHNKKFRFAFYVYFVVCRVYWEPKSLSNHRIFHLLVRMLGNDYECLSKNKRISKDAKKNYLASSWVVRGPSRNTIDLREIISNLPFCGWQASRPASSSNNNGREEK